MPKEYDLSQIEAPPWDSGTLVAVPEGVAKMTGGKASFGQLTKAMYFNESLAGTVSEAAAAKLAIMLQDDDPEYNPYTDPQVMGLPPEEFSHYVGSRSAGETSIIMERIRQEREWRQMIAEEGLTARSVAAGLLGNAGDVALAIASGGLAAGGAAAERTLLQKTAMAAGAAAVTEAGAEGVKQVTQYERTGMESAVNIAGAAVFGGLVPVAGAAWRKLVKGHEKEAIKAAGEPLVEAMIDDADVTMIDPGDTAGLIDPPYKISVSDNAPAASYIANALDTTGATPNARTQSYEVPEVGSTIRDLFSTNFILNKNLKGIASDSAERRIWKHNVRMEGAVTSVWNAYKRYLKEEGASFFERQKAGLGGKPGRYLSFDEFDSLVGQYVQDGADADTIRKTFGYEPDERILEGAKAVADYFSYMKGEIKASKIAPELADPNEGLGYFSRYWKAKEMQRRQSEALADMKGIVRQLDPTLDEDAVTEAANDIITNITGARGIIVNGRIGTATGPLKGRVLKVPDHMVRKWTVQSATEVMQRYNHHVAPRVELAKMAVRNPSVENLRSRIESLAKTIGMPSIDREGISEAKQQITGELEQLLAQYDADEYVYAAKEFYQASKEQADVEQLQSMLGALSKLEQSDAKSAITGNSSLKLIEGRYRKLIEEARNAGNDWRVNKLVSEQERAMKEVRSAYQVMTNSYGNEVDPTGFMSRGIDAAMKWSVVTKMGRITLNQINDLATLPMRYGWQATYKASKAHWGAFKSAVAKESADELRLWANANDTVLSTRMLQMAEMNQTYLTQTGAENTVDWFYRRMGSVSGFNLWSENFKMVSGYAASDTIYRHAISDSLTDYEKGLMGSIGLNQKTLKALGKAKWIDHNGVKVPDWGTLAPDLRDKLGLAIRQMTEASTNAPTKGMVPYWTKHPYGRMAAQFKGFLFGVTENTNAFIEQKARLGTPKEKLHAMSGLGALVGLGAVSAALIEWSYGRDPDLTSAKFAMDAIDRSGAVALLMEANNTLEGLTTETLGQKNMLGVRRAMGMVEPGARFYGRSPAEMVLGPAGGVVEDSMRAGFGTAAIPFGYQPSKQYYKSLMKLTPYNNVVWLTSLPYEVADIFMDLPAEPRKEIPERLAE